MTYLLVALFFGMQTKPDGPITITINASAAVVRTALEKDFLTDYEQCGESTDRLTFCKSEKPKRAFVDRLESTITLLGSDSVTLIASSEIKRKNIFGGERRVRGMNKSERVELQHRLDRLKVELEH